MVQRPRCAGAAAILHRRLQTPTSLAPRHRHDMQKAARPRHAPARRQQVGPAFSAQPARESAEGSAPRPGRAPRAPQPVVQRGSGGAFSKRPLPLCRRKWRGAPSLPQKWGGFRAPRLLQGHPPQEGRATGHQELRHQPKGGKEPQGRERQAAAEAVLVARHKGP